MNKDIAILTHDSIYAYNFRNKFQNRNWIVEYLNSIEDLKKYISERHNGIIFIDSRSGVIESNFSYLKSNLSNFVFVYIDDENIINEEYYSNTEIIYTNSENLDINESKIIELLERKIGDRERYNSAKIYNSIPEALISFGLSPKRIGYKYLQECIEMCLKMNKLFICYKEDVYPHVAKIFNVSNSAIEKSIRSSLKEAYDKFPELFNNDVFKFGHPTNNQFINFLLERIK